MHSLATKQTQTSSGTQYINFDNLKLFFLCPTYIFLYATRCVASWTGLLIVSFPFLAFVFSAIATILCILFALAVAIFSFAIVVLIIALPVYVLTLSFHIF